MAGQRSRNNAKGTTQPGIPSLLVAKNPIWQIYSPLDQEKEILLEQI